MRWQPTAIWCWGFKFWFGSPISLCQGASDNKFAASKRVVVAALKSSADGTKWGFSVDMGVKVHKACMMRWPEDKWKADADVKAAVHALFNFKQASAGDLLSHSCSVRTAILKKLLGTDASATPALPDASTLEL